MGYKNANDVLPAPLLRAVQAHIDGECLYVPRKEGNKRSWGENTKTKEKRSTRNREIVSKRQAGCSVADLAKQYFLSPKAVYKIVKAAENG